MKKALLFFFACITLGIASISAQTSIFAGLNVGNVTAGESSFVGDYDSKTGFDLGFTFSIPVSTPLRVQLSPSVRKHIHEFNGISYGEGSLDLTRKTSLTRLVLPVTLVYDWHVSDDVTLSGGLGIAFRYSLSGKNEASGFFMGTPLSFDTEYDLEFGTEDEVWFQEEVGIFGQDLYYVYDNSNLKAFDTALDIRFSATFKQKFIVSVARQNGFTPFFSNGSTKGLLKDTQLSFGILLSQGKT